MWHQGFNYNFAKLQEYLLCAKEIKNKNELFNNSSPPSYHLLPFWRVLQNVIKLISAVNVRGDECNQHWGMHALWYSPKWWKMVTQGRRIAEESRYFCFVCAKKVKLRKSEVEWSELRGEELLKKVVIFVLFARKKWSFAKVMFSEKWSSHMDCFIDVSGPGNISVVLRPMDGQKTVRFHQKYLNLCSEDERRSYGFRTTWGRVINDRIFILGWTNLLTWWANQKTHHPLHQHIKGRPVRGLLYDGFSGCWRSGPLIVSRCRGTCRRERGHWLHVLSDLY